MWVAVGTDFLDYVVDGSPVVGTIVQAMHLIVNARPLVDHQTVGETMSAVDTAIRAVARV
jgi:hypothetical protein